MLRGVKTRCRSFAFAAAGLLLFGTAACGSKGVELEDLVDGGGGEGGAVVTLADAAGPTTFTDPFAGAPAYAAPSNLTPSPAPNHNVGNSCMNCHGNGQTAFLIGGTIYKDFAGKTPAAGVEIRIVDTNGHAASTYSNSDGNFFIKSAGSTVALPAWVGARDGTTKRPMITQLTPTDGSCGQAFCHDNGGNGPVHLP